MKLSIIIPCYNETNTILEILEKIKQNYKDYYEIIIIDDFSTDGTREKLKEISKSKLYKIIFNDGNYGKGFSIRQGISSATGEIILIQDADLEYSPEDYNKLLKPIKSGYADVVYGSRFIGGEYVRLHFFWHYLANKILTILTNIITNLNMTDMETGYKVFKTSILKPLKLKENSFGIEPELTIKLAKKGFTFYEVPISYKGRSYQDGKKITFKDAMIAVFCIIKYRFFD